MTSCGPTNYSIVKFVKGFGQSLLHWINYLHAVERSKIINEYAIRYATSEYLETKMESKSVSPLMGEFYPTSYKFEESFPIFNDDRKHADLHVYSEFPEEFAPWNVDVFMEFKYLKDETNKLNEYKKDIYRLAVLTKNNPGSHAFFLLATANGNSLNNAPVVAEETGSKSPASVLTEGDSEEHQRRKNTLEERTGPYSSLLSTSSVNAVEVDRKEFPFTLVTEEQCEAPEYRSEKGKLKKNIWVVNDDVKDITENEKVTTSLIYAPVIMGNIDTQEPKVNVVKRQIDEEKHKGLRVFIWEVKYKTL